MVLRGDVVSFMNGNGGVDDLYWELASEFEGDLSSGNYLRLNSLFLDDWHNGLMDVVMDSLASHSWSSYLAMRGFMGFRRVLEAAELRRYSCLGILIVLMSELFVFDGDHVMMVLLREGLLVADWLNSGMVVVLVDFSVHCLGDILMSVRVDSFLCDGRVHNFVN